MNSGSAVLVLRSANSRLGLKVNGLDCKEGADLSVLYLVSLVTEADTADRENGMKHNER